MQFKSLIAATLMAASGLLSPTASPVRAAEDEGWGLKLDPYFETGMSKCSIDQPIPANWQDGFKPGRPTQLDKGNAFLMDLGLRLEPFYRTSDFQVGLPISYSLNLMSGDWASPFLGGSSRTVAQTTTEWWGDTVYVCDIVAKQKTPRVGINFEKDRWALQYSIQGYELDRRYFQGVDNFGPNGSATTSSEKVESGIAHRFDIGYKILTEDKTAPNFNIGLFYEKMGSADTFGFNIRTNLEGWKLFR